MVTEFDTVLVRSVKTMRCSADYPGMQRYANEINARLDGDNSKAASGIHSKVSYELGMGEQQQFKACMEQAQQHLQASLRYHELSAKQARDADDEVGVLIAEANIYGLLYPRLGKWEEGRNRSERICQRLKEIAEDLETTEEDRGRAQRFVVNSLFHCIDITMEFDPTGLTSWRCVEYWLKEAKRNPFYISQPTLFAAAIEAAEKFLQQS